MEKNNLKNKLLKYIIIIILIVIIILAISCFCINWDNYFTKIGITDTTPKITYEDKELTGEWTEYTGKVTLENTTVKIEGNGVTNNGNSIIINDHGTYYITGSIEDGNIVIEAEQDDEVQLVLDNCSIASKTTAPINIIKAKKMMITLAEKSENSIIDNSSYTQFTDIENMEPDATIFSKTDLVINGSGKLTVNANYGDGISSKEGLKVANGEIIINASDDGIKGETYIAINKAKIKVHSKKDAIDSDGTIIIDNGIIKIESGDDGIHAETDMIINQANIDIVDSYEGIEGHYIEINGGIISVIAKEDGINAAGEEGVDKKIIINGGNVFVNAEGDGLDSNGTINVNGGTVIIAGPTYSGNGALDYAISCDISGGDVIIYGSKSMWENPSETSTQYILTFKISGESGDKITLKDNFGNEIKSFKTDKMYQTLMISNEKIKKGNTYTLYINETIVDSIKVNNIVNTKIIKK